MNHDAKKKLMGKISTLPKMEMGPIKEALGDRTPKLDPNPLGRFRLATALKGHYGAGYKNVPAAQKALQHFDSESHFFQTLMKTRSGK